MPPSRVHLLGVPIDAVTFPAAIAAIRGFLENSRQHHVMTPNSEMLVEATKNSDFLSVLRATSLNLPDSFGIVLMSRLRGQPLPGRVSGVDVSSELLRSLTREHPVFLLGAAPGIAEKVALRMQQENPNLKIVGVYAGSPREEDSQVILAMIRASAPHLLLVAFGAPLQDLWISRHIKEMPSVRIAMGVGGTFDFLAGVRKRAPAWMQKSGLEWLFRLLREPRRIRRIFNAVVVFPLLVLFRGGTGANN
ncbi:MAG: WecB/TagA/CpsF family glycosyltransferase [Candidatus Peregrinibacteria bacterium]